MRREEEKNERTEQTEEARGVMRFPDEEIYNGWNVVKMKTFEFEKQGIKFSFRNPGLDQYGTLVMEWKIEGIKENKDNDGYYYNSEFLSDKNAMSLVDVKINGKKIAGVVLPKDVLTEIKAIYEQLKAERENNINQVVNELVEGKRNIYFHIVGCDFPYYQAWVRNLPKDLQGLEQDIMTRAIKAIMGKNEYVSNPCDYLQKAANKNIGSIEELGGNILNPEFNAEIQKYYGYKNTVVTGFEMKLVDILQPVLEKREAYKKKLDAIFEKAKKTGEAQVIREWVDECNEKDLDCSLDIIRVYAMPNGTTKEERIHTY